LRAAEAGLKRGLGWFFGSLVLFLLLPQRAPHSMDTHFFMVWLEEGHQEYPRHPLYMQLARLSYEAVQLVGGRPYTALLLLSALGGALAVAFGAAALQRFLRDTEPRLPAAIGIVCVPALFYYATAAEIGGVAAGAAGMAWWALACFRDRPSLTAAALVGVCTGLAAGVHAFGHLLVPLFGLAALVLRMAPGRARFGYGAVMALVHLMVAVAAAVVAGVGAKGQATDAWGHLLERWVTLAPSSAPRVFWTEWLLAYAPWSFLAFLGLRSARSRPFALVTLGGLGLHVPLTILLLGSIGAEEDGMYHLALAVPAVATAWLSLSPSLVRVAVLIGVGVIGLLAGPHWPQPGTAAFGSGLQALRAEGNFVLVSTTQERDAARARVAQDLIILELDRLLGFYLPAQQAGKSPQQWFAELMAMQPAPVLFTKDAAGILAQFGPPLQGLWASIQRDYQCEWVARDGFTGVWVRKR
jgi:hypothetical protein